MAEIDFLLRKRLGVAAEVALLEGLRAGAFALEPFTRVDLDRGHELVVQYGDADIGLAGAAVVATAERLGIHRILTVVAR